MELQALPVVLEPTLRERNGKQGATGGDQLKENDTETPRGPDSGPTLLFPEPHSTRLGRMVQANPADHDRHLLDDNLAGCHACVSRRPLGVPGVQGHRGAGGLLSLEEEDFRSPLPFL